MPRRRPAGFAGNEHTTEAVRFSANPITAYAIGVVDRVLGQGMAGEIGHIPAGEKQTRKYSGALASPQNFIGAAQLTNLVNAKIGLNTAIPATKPNPGVIPLTAMQQQLATLAAR